MQCVLVNALTPLVLNQKLVFQILPTQRCFGLISMPMVKATQNVYVAKGIFQRTIQLFKNIERRASVGFFWCFVATIIAFAIINTKTSLPVLLVIFFAAAFGVVLQVNGDEFRLCESFQRIEI